jgi:UDP-N-acetylglucosamine 2-epimerase (non-hydrolysing)
MKIISIVGARPNFVKIAPILEAFGQYPGVESLLVHTGQHYDRRMSDVFFQMLGIPDPDVHLGVGSSTHAQQTAAIMTSFEPVVREHRPDAVLVVGDVNSTVACSLVAAKMGVAVIHVEAGLRSRDRRMPEEINRLVTDAISDLLFCSEQAAVDNLRTEGVSSDKVFLVGNVMIDTLVKQYPKLRGLDTLQMQGVEPQGYGLLTLHRPSNVDQPEIFSNILDALTVIQQDLPIVFPVHPRTWGILESTPLGQRIRAMSNLRLSEPMDYLRFLHLMAEARLVITDSGGIQEETTFLKVPCLTIRENTERPCTCEIGSSQLTGTRTSSILAAYRRIQDGALGPFQIPALWDGKTADRIVEIIWASLAAPST